MLRIVIVRLQSHHSCGVTVMNVPLWAPTPSSTDKGVSCFCSLTMTDTGETLETKWRPSHWKHWLEATA